MKLAQWGRGIAVLGTLAAACLVPRAGAQNPGNMMPDQSEAKGRQILRDLIMKSARTSFWNKCIIAR